MKIWWIFQLWAICIWLNLFSHIDPPETYSSTGFCSLLAVDFSFSIDFCSLTAICSLRILLMVPKGSQDFTQKTSIDRLHMYIEILLHHITSIYTCHVHTKLNWWLYIYIYKYAFVCFNIANCIYYIHQVYVMNSTMFFLNMSSAHLIEQNTHRDMLKVSFDEK